MNAEQFDKQTQDLEMKLNCALTLLASETAAKEAETERADQAEKQISKLEEDFFADFEKLDNKATAAEERADRAERALRECYVAIEGTVLGTSWELAPELREELSKAGNLARAALSPIPSPAK